MPTPLRLTSVLIENFRGILHVELALDETTVLIGENNCGKTTVIDAIRICLKELRPRGRTVFDSHDFHLKDAGSDPSTAAPIKIILTFAEHQAGEWDAELIGRLNRLKILQVDALGCSFVTLRVICAYNATSRDFEQEWAFVNGADQKLPNVLDNALVALQSEVTFFYLSALRDAVRHFDAKGQFWRPFLKDSELAADKRTEIEDKLQEVNDLVVGSHASFEKALESLRQIQEVVKLGAGDIVSIEAVPARIFDMLARAQVNLCSSGGAQLPVGRHGEGTQSLAVLLLFAAFLKTWPAGAPLVALEEPEAHLHPSAVRALWEMLAKISGQKLISTHSGDLLSEVDVHAVRRLARTPGGVVSRSVARGLLSDEEARKLHHHIRRNRGELLFARAWLLVEGESESWVFPAAARALGGNFHREGVRVVEYSQSDVGLLAKVANALGIPWYCVVDDDSGRQKYEASIQANLGGIAATNRYCAPYHCLEVHLLGNGFNQAYVPHMPAQNLAKIAVQPGDPTYWTEYASNLPSRAKTKVAAAVAAEMEAIGPNSVSPILKSIVGKVVNLAILGAPP
jgi:putative ATP-dependent endonuclease of OLD family